MHGLGWILGWVAHGLVAFTLIGSGAAKVMRPPKQIVDNFTKWGILRWLKIVGAGEIVTGALLAVPQTTFLGVLLASAVWGGAIMIHLSHEEPFIVESVLAGLTWVGAILKAPSLFGG